MGCVELQVQYSNYKNALQGLAQKIGDVEQEAEEHKFLLPLHSLRHSPLFFFFVRRKLMGKVRLVLESLAPVPKGRKCFRLINGVLVERTVGDVVPALETNAEGLRSVLEGLVKEYKKKQEEMDKWKV